MVNVEMCRLYMKIITTLILTSLSLLSPDAFASSCMDKNRLVVRCQESVCDEGYLIPFKRLGATCDLVSSFSKAETSFRLAPSVSQLVYAYDQVADGIYRIDFSVAGTYRLKSIPHIACVELLNKGELELKCPQASYRIDKIDMDGILSLDEIKKHLVSESRKENFIKYSLYYSPLGILLLLSLLAIRCIKRIYSIFFWGPSTVFSVLLFGISAIGLRDHSLLLSSPLTWGLVGSVTNAIVGGAWLLYLIKNWQNRKNASSNSS